MNAMKVLPLAPTMSLDVGVIHFIGIGGIGMSGIAEILHNQGYKVQGSDLSESANVERLRAKGMEIFIGQREENIANADVIVKSTAVKEDNPEIIAARTQRIPVVKRSEMLAEVMRLKMCVAIAGTHGKTTTTSLTATLLEAGGLEPTIINGGIINKLGTNAKVGKGDWLVVEADESDGTFTRLPISVGVITNIDPEHLDYYGDFETLKGAFAQFLDNLPFYGFAALCIDHPEVQKLASTVKDRRILTYGTSPQADIRADNIRGDAEGQRFDLRIFKPVDEEEQIWHDVSLPMHGRHNLLNALAAIAVAEDLGMPVSAIKSALAEFEGVKRRFTPVDEVNGVRIIDDYAHHPVEIKATLSSARQAVEATGGKVIAIAQPHRYSRVESLFDDFCTCFNQADKVFITPIFEAGEKPIKGISQESLVEGIRAAGHREVHAVDAPEGLPHAIEKHAEAGDIVVCMGAGSISNWANALPERMA
jgi:UDP-N-acetylmuramate--alanine ligase